MNVLEIIRFFNLKQVYCVLVEDMIDISTQLIPDAKGVLHTSITVRFCGYPRHTSLDTKYYRVAFTDQGKLLSSQADDCLIFPSKEERTWENLHNEMIQQQKSNGMENISKIIIEHKIEEVYCPLLGEMIAISTPTEKCISAKVRLTKNIYGAVGQCYTTNNGFSLKTIEKTCVKTWYFDEFGRFKGIDEAYRDASYAECAIFPNRTEKNWSRHNKVLKGTARSTSLLEDETDLLELSL